MTLTKYNVPQEVEKKILTAIELKKELAQYELEIKEALQEAMTQSGITSIKNDKYTVTLASRNSYKAVDQVADEFKKESLDTAKVGKYVALYGEVPAGVEQSVTEYITWKAK